MKKLKQRLYKVRVTKDDIKQGEASSPAFCPIALAVSRVTHEDVEVEAEVLRIVKNDEEIDFDLPKKLKTFVRRFDDGKVVEPFEFELTLPRTVPGSLRV